MPGTGEPASTQTIGIVLVHGVGEQRRFDHLSAEVRHLVAALSALPETQVSVQTRATQDSATGAEHESWRAETDAPVQIHVAQGFPERRFRLCVHEAWWADLDDKETLWNRIRFWFWGLGFWGVKKFDDAHLRGSVNMVFPKLPSFAGGDGLREIIVRARLWAFANVFILSALTVNLLNSVLKGLRLGQIPGVEVFYQYVGDVKLYQDRRKPGRGSLTDIGEARRVTIRRRIVQVFVDAYRADYDRWYVLAHSLGTVVAWNGLMETAHSLPNYLSRETHAALKDARDPVLGPQKSGPVLPVTDMRPARPVWITSPDEVLYREVLFRKLRGLVTYGSPLDKFAYLWRAIVPINKDTAVWRKDFEWINVYEHTDPVSSRLAAFSGPGVPAGSPTPANFAYRASRFLLLSHLRYLRLRKRGDRAGSDQLVLRLVSWMLDGSSRFPVPATADRSWYRRTSPSFGLAVRTPWWLVGTAVFAAALAWLGVPALLDLLAWLAGLGALDKSPVERWVTAMHDWFAALSFPQRLWAVVAVSATAVFLTGGARWLLEQWIDRGNRQEQ